MSERTWTCPDCSATLTRHRAKNHARLYCPKNGAPALQPRKCRREECGNMFVPHPSHPSQEYCSRGPKSECWRLVQKAKRRDKYEHNLLAGKEGRTKYEQTEQEERHAEEMKPLVVRLKAAKEMAATYTPLMGEALWAATMQLMRAA